MGKPQRTVDITDAIASMPTTFVVCRDLRHSWDPYTAFKIKGGYDEQFRCSKCGTIKRRILNAYGDIVETPPYEYPDGYRIKGLGHLTSADRSMVRLQSVESRAKSRPADA